MKAGFDFPLRAVELNLLLLSLNREFELRSKPFTLSIQRTRSGLRSLTHGFQAGGRRRTCWQGNKDSPWLHEATRSDR